MQTYQTSGSIRAILQVAGPIAISMAIPQIQQFVNTSFIGHFSTLDQSVLGIGGIVFLFLLSFAFGISNGALIFFSRYSGRDDRLGLGRSFNTLVVSALLISVMVAVLYFLFFDEIVISTLRDPMIVSRVLDYLDVLIFSFPVFIVLQVFNSFLIAIGRSILILRITLIGTITHIFMDYILIYGKLGFPSIGIIGSAYATIFSEAVMLVVALFILYKKGFAEFYSLRFFERYSRGRAWNQLKICTPLILQYLITLGGWLVFFVLIENMGKEYLAASQAVRAAMSFCSIFIWSFGGVANSFTSNLVGQDLIGRARQTIYRIAAVSLSGTIIFSLLFYFIPETIMGVLTSDSNVIALGIGPLRVLATSILFMSFGCVLFNSIIGTGRIRVSILIEVVAVLSYLIFLFKFLLPMEASLTQMWWSEYVYWIMLGSISMWYIHSVYFGRQSDRAEF